MSDWETISDDEGWETIKPATNGKPVPQRPDSNWYDPDRLAANPAIRFATGAASPIMGAGEWLPGSMGDWFAQNNREMKSLVDKGKLAQSDYERITGNTTDFVGMVMSPAFLKLAKIMPAAKSLKALIGTGAVTGLVGGATAPIGSSDTIDKVIAAGTGMATGAALTPAIAGLLKGGANMFGSAFSDKFARRGAAKEVIKIAGDDAEEFASMLVNGSKTSNLETAAQIATPLQNTRIAALQSHWNSKFGSQPALKNERAQEALEIARVEYLGATTQPARQAAIEKANRITGFYKMAEAKARAYAGKAGASVDDVRRLEIARSKAMGYDIDGRPTIGTTGRRGMTSKPQIGSGLTQASDLIPIANKGMDDAALESIRFGSLGRLADRLKGGLEARGLKPLMADDFTNSINSIKTSDKNISNKGMRLFMNSVLKEINLARKPDGTISAESLDTIRRTTIGDYLESVAMGSPSQAKKLAATEGVTLKKMIDEAIDKAAGNKEYSKYMKDYSEARTLLELPMKNFQDFTDISKRGTAEVNRILNDEVIASPNMLNTAATMGRAVYRGARGVAGKRVGTEGAKLMQPGGTKELGMLMQQLQENPYGIVGDAVRNQTGLISYGMLSGEDQ